MIRWAVLLLVVSAADNRCFIISLIAAWGEGGPVWLGEIIDPFRSAVMIHVC